jgi:hypothetical protein
MNTFPKQPYTGYADEPLESPMFSPDDLIGSGGVKAAVAALKGSPMLLGVVKNLFHGGTYNPGESIRDVLYAAEDPKMAKTFVDMYNDRYGGGAGLRKFAADLEPHQQAPISIVQKHAEAAGIPFEDYTPASAFDVNLHGEEPVKQLIKALRDRNYTHTVLEDMAYGYPRGSDNINTTAHVLFPDIKTIPNR